MGKYKQYKRGLSAWISSEKGQRFFNFAYSIGAAIVIWGALFKILHLPGGNFLLSLGMGTSPSPPSTAPRAITNGRKSSPCSRPATPKTVLISKEALVS